MSTIELIQGDCLEKMKNISDGSVDLTVTSPPYDNLRTYNGNITQWSEQKWKDIIKDLFRVTKQGGVVVWVVGDATINGSETGTSFKQALWAKNCGFNLNDTMIWNKCGFSAVGTLESRYASVFEYMFVFTKGRIKTFNPIKDRKTIHYGKIVGGTIRQPDGTTKPMSKLITINEYCQRFNIWEQFSQRQKRQINGHPAPFPEKIVYDHIISWSNKGDMVFDPMMGSGTTGKMARLLNRNFIGIEIDPEYFRIAEKRIYEQGVLNFEDKLCYEKGG